MERIYSLQLELVELMPLTSLIDEKALFDWEYTLSVALEGTTLAQIPEPFFGIRHGYLPRKLPKGYVRKFVPRFQNLIAAGSAGTQLFSTKAGYLGSGPLGMQEGDVISVLFGSNVPFVMRGVGHYYILVGECFVLGLMDGEIAEIISAGLARCEALEIR